MDKKELSKMEEVGYYFDDDGYFFDFNNRLDNMEAIYDILMERTNYEETILRGKYNYASKVVVYLKDKSQDKMLDIYTSLLRKRGLDISTLYVSYYDKCSDEDLNKKAFVKEIKLFGKDTTFLMHNIPYNLSKIPFNNIVKIDYDDYIANFYKKGVSKEEKREIKKYLFTKVKKAFTKVFRDNIEQSDK